jgi:hypothetical protein
MINQVRNRRDLASVYQNVSALKIANARVHRYDRGVANEHSRQAFLQNSPVSRRLDPAFSTSSSIAFSSGLRSAAPRRAKRNHPAARVGHNDLLLYADRGISVRGRTVCLAREHHACLDLHWPIERDQARNIGRA